jgi:hypothetical protein
MIKLIDTIDSEIVLSQYKNLEKDITWLEVASKKQSGLQYRLGDDMWIGSTGKQNGSEKSYCELNPLFAGTIFEEIINKYKLIRTRFMWMGPNSCYSMHRDTSPRIHVPIITNDDCYLVFKQGIIQHMEVGSVYWADTREIHTAMNCSSIPRLHLVGGVVS